MLQPEADMFKPTGTLTKFNKICCLESHFVVLKIKLFDNFEYLFSDILDNKFRMVLKASNTLGVVWLTVLARQVKTSPMAI